MSAPHPIFVDALVGIAPPAAPSIREPSTFELAVHKAMRDLSEVCGWMRAANGASVIASFEEEASFCLAEVQRTFTEWTRRIGGDAGSVNFDDALVHPILTTAKESDEFARHHGPRRIRR